MEFTVVPEPTVHAPSPTVPASSRFSVFSDVFQLYQELILILIGVNLQQFLLLQLMAILQCDIVTLNYQGIELDIV